MDGRAGWGTENTYSPGVEPPGGFAVYQCSDGRAKQPRREQQCGGHTSKRTELCEATADVLLGVVTGHFVWPVECLSRPLTSERAFEHTHYRERRSQGNGRRRGA